MSPFERNVFVNCPFDPEYLPLFRPLIFAILYLGFSPRIANERADSGEPRIQKILQLIEESKFGIHDLSRCKAKNAGEYFRFNLPFELGLDLACRRYRPGKARTKCFLIIETERYQFTRAVSDIAGSDIKAHQDDPLSIITVVRNWLVQQAGAPARPPSVIMAKFTDFMAEDYRRLTKLGFTMNEIQQLPDHEVHKAMKNWIAARVARLG